MALFASCQGLNKPQGLSHSKYMTDLQCLERIHSFIGQEEFASALVENTKLERRHEESINGQDDYSRVILSSAQMNAALLKKLIQDEKTFSLLFEEVEQQGLIITKQKSAMDQLALKQEEMKSLLKTVENLEAENKKLHQQIKDFKKIDLEGDKINSGT
jgi:hypothetical protein